MAAHFPPAGKKKPPAAAAGEPGIGSLILVLVNGAILTVAATILMNLFTHQMAEGRAYIAQSETAQVLAERVRQVDSDFQIAAILAPLRDGPLRIRNLVWSREQGATKLPFTHLLWVPSTSNADGGGPHFLYPVVGDDTLPLQKIVALVRAAYSARPKFVGQETYGIGLSGVLPTRQVHNAVENGILRVQMNTVALAQPVRDADNREGMLIGLLPMEKFVSLPGLTQKSYFERIRVLDRTQNSRLLDAFYVHGPTDPDPGEGALADAIAFPLANWASSLTVRVALRGDDVVQTMNYLPLLVAIFGILITGLGALYVRNNHRQATLMARMNRTLALKNMELNSQVTERERLNQILRKTERDHKAIINAVGEVIFEVDMQGRILFLNDAWRLITGNEAAQSLGQPIFDLLEGVDLHPHVADFQALMRGQRGAFSFICRLRVLEVGARTVEVTFSMTRLDDNKAIRAVGTISDIEERHKAEYALAEAEQKYRAIWENAVSGIYQITPDGQLLSANPAMLRMFGFLSLEEMRQAVTNVNRQLYTSAKERQAMLRDLMLSGQVQNIEIEGLRRNHTRFWGRESARLVKDSQGQVLYIEGSIDDVTEQKLAEIKLREAMVASDLANRSKTDFLANMSHELRTPLNAIIGFSEIIRDQAFGPIAQSQYVDYARDIHESGRGLMGIINTILDVARIEAGERELNETLVKVAPMVRSAVEMVRSKAEANQQTVEIVMPESLPDLVCEELAVKQILLNLLTNAVKYTPTGGRISVTAGIEPSGDLRLAVTDTGVGLDAEEIARVMTPFGGQATGSFSRSSSGAGLGLTLVHLLTRLHGGRVEMVSQKGVGTTVGVTLPAGRLQVG